MLSEKQLADLAAMKESLQEQESKTELFVVVSGRPKGEVYHRQVLVTNSEFVADYLYQDMCEQVEDQSKAWLWGPHIFSQTEADEWPHVWNGHKEVPAKKVREIVVDANGKMVNRHTVPLSLYDEYEKRHGRGVTGIGLGTKYAGGRNG